MLLNVLKYFHRLLILLIIFIAIPMIGAAYYSDSEKLLDEGVAEYKSGNLDTSFHIFEDITLQNPSWPYGWLWKGTVLADLKKQEEADVAFKTGSCLLNPDSCEDYSKGDSGKIYRQYETFPNDHASLSSSFFVDYPQSFETGNNYYILSDDPNKSTRESKQFVHPELFDKEGDLFNSAGRIDEAIQSFQHAEELDPDNSTYSRKLGDMYAKKGDLNSALSAWNRSIEKESEKEVIDDILKKRSDTFSALGKPYNAGKELEKMNFPRNNPTTIMEKGDFFTQSGDYHLAEEAYLEYLDAFPGNTDASLGLANAQINLGKYQKGKKILDSIPESSLNPKQMDLYTKTKMNIPEQSEKLPDLTFLFRNHVLYLFIIIGIVGIVFFRKKIFK